MSVKLPSNLYAGPKVNKNRYFVDKAYDMWATWTGQFIWQIVPKRGFYVVYAVLLLFLSKQLTQNGQEKKVTCSLKFSKNQTPKKFYSLDDIVY